MAWERTSPMCVSLAATLIRLDQISSSATFDSIGPMKMQELQFYNILASADVNESSALQIAVSVDSIMINSYLDTYEKDFDRIKAIDLMASVMKVAGKTVADLSVEFIKIYGIS